MNNAAVILTLGTALMTPALATGQMTNGLLINSFESSADLLAFSRNNC